jgi:hypothetical protein
MMQSEVLAARLGVAILFCALWAEGMKISNVALLCFLLTVVVNSYLPQRAQPTER